MSRGKQPTSRPAADHLPLVAGRLSDRDRQLCRLLHDHQVLTSDQLAHLLATRRRTLQQRLAELTALQVVDRFRPHTGVGAGSASYHYLLGETGARVLATETATSLEGLGWSREQLLRLAHANGALTHLLGVNSLLAGFTHAAHNRPQARLVCWWPARRCHARWGRLIAPDAYVRWQDPSGEVDFFLHYDPGQPELEQLAGLLAGYNDLAVATRITTPVLWWLTDADRETDLRRLLADQRLVVPAATANPTCGTPADPVWLPTSSPDGNPRYRLGELGHPEPWQPQHPDRQPPLRPRPRRPAIPPVGLEPSGPWR
jgi:hypothetical protein